MEHVFDILIVGGGISGTLMAERLITKYPGKSIALLNRERQLGGRILTYEGQYGHQLELGAMRIPEANRLTLALCHRLGLELEPFIGGVSPCNTYLFNQSALIHTNKLYTDIISQSLTRFCSTGNDNLTPILALYQKMFFKLSSLGIVFSKLSFREWVEIVINPHDQALFWDLLGYDYLKFPDVSALSCLLHSSNHDEYHSSFYHIKGGMQRLVSTLLNNFLARTGNLLKSDTVEKIEYSDSTYVLSTNLGQTYKSKTLTLAIPPVALLEIHKRNPFLNGKQLGCVEAIGHYSSVKTYALLPFLEGLNAQQISSGFFRTNLSIRQGHWQPCQKPGIDRSLMILAEYRNQALSHSKNTVFSTEVEWARISSDLNMITKSLIPQPRELVRHDWTQHQSGIAAHYWRKAYNPNSVLQLLNSPNTSCWLVGEAFSCQHGWIEGAIASVNNVVELIN
jgi:monoamine oxidase